MFSGIKKFAAVCIVLAVVCAIAAILCLMMLAPAEYMDKTLLICVAGFTGSVALIAVTLSFTLWNLASELAVHSNSNFEDISSLKKRIEKLEKTQ